MDFEGEIDENGKACGFGVATCSDDVTVFKGTWLNGEAHG